MIDESQDHSFVVLSVKLYRALLVAYPTRFQQEYGLHMTQVFRDCCLRSVRQHGTNGMLKLWAVTLIDLAQSVISEHAHKETQMKKEMKPEDIRRAGWSLILGAFLFVPIMLVGMSPAGARSQLPVLLLVFADLPLLAYGVLGVRKQYGEKAGSVAKNILLIGAILGPVVSVLGILLVPEGRLWFVSWLGPGVLLACLSLFGIAALITRPMPRWNILPFIAGLPYPALFLYYIVASSLSGYWEGSHGIPDSVSSLLFVLQVIALAALGYSLKADVPEGTAALA